MLYFFFLCLLYLYILFCHCRCCTWMWRRCCRERELRARVIQIGQLMHEKFPTNVIRNQKYNIVTFLPLVRIRLYY